LIRAPREGVGAKRSRESRKKDAMLKIYSVVLEVVAGVRPVICEIERRDPDLARQMRRAAASVALNVSEGMYSRGRNRQARYHNAMGSMRETLACIEVGEALGYVDGVDARLRASIDHVVGTLYKLCA
jgi:four helix bundle protein